MKKERIGKRELRNKIRRNPEAVKAYLAAHPDAVAHFSAPIQEKIKHFLNAKETDKAPALTSLDETLEKSIKVEGDDVEQESTDAVTNTEVNPA